VRRTKARRRFRLAAVAAARAVTSSEAVRLRESKNEVELGLVMGSSELLVTPLLLLLIIAESI
jgi:hypothetical protein